MTSWRERFEKKDRFLIGAEFVSARSLIKPSEGGKIIDFVDGLCKNERVDWVSITDNAGGNPMQAPLILGKAILDRGKPAVIHITCKDYNRNGLESLAWMYAAEGLNNLLVLSGDYPIDGVDGVSKSVFDIASVGLLKILTDMNNGLKVKGRKPGSIQELESTDFFLADIAYLCPQSQCAKNQRNGPCGGSLEGKCELKTFGKECIWIRAYDRERYFGKGIPELLNRPPILKDNALKGTSGWANFFLERDHFVAR